MTIASQISRLQTDKECIRQAIIDKGVNVGADLTLDEYAACISAIESIKKFKFDLLVVGGGGSGGYKCCYNYFYNGGGGGGGGGYICISKSITEFDTHCFPVVVGCGAAGGNGVTWNQRGGDSCFGDVVACGGGSGASYYCYNDWGNQVVSPFGAFGGSGGGGNYCGSPGDSVPGQGNIGGNWDGSDYYSAAGRGGGGASSAGCNNSGRCGGNGGDGCMNDMLGQNYYFSGGGGGGKGQNGVDGIGGNGGANAGADAQCYGGGGGGYSYGGNKSGSGKQGIVVVRYKTDGSCGITEATGGCKYTCGDYTIHCFTSDGAFCIVS